MLRGERWDFNAFTSSTTLSLPGGRTAVSERVRLADTAAHPLEDVLGGLDAAASIVVFGPRTVGVQLDLAALAESLTAEAAERRQKSGAAAAVAHRIRRSLTLDSPTERALLGAVGGTPTAELLPTEWSPPSVPRLHSPVRLMPAHRRHHKLCADLTACASAGDRMRR